MKKPSLKGSKNSLCMMRVSVGFFIRPFKIASLSPMCMLSSGEFITFLWEGFDGVDLFSPMTLAVMFRTPSLRTFMSKMCFFMNPY